MKIAYSILKRFLNQLTSPVETIVDTLTSQGFVVESMSRSSDIFSPNLITATVVNRKSGVVSDVCTVQVKDRHYDIKCAKWGAPEIGNRVLLNQIGEAVSTQPLLNQRPGEKEEFFIVLPDEINEGEFVYPTLIGDDWVFDVEITANRGDCMSILGLARELSAGLDLELTLPPHQLVPDGLKADFKVIVEDYDLCPFYSGRLAKNMIIKPSPWWIIHELYLLGLRPINNIVDITNLVMMETGQPLHAFDANRITDQKIIVRRAKNNEHVTTLDGVERKLTNSMLVIADSTFPIAIAGIMGGYQSEVSSSTQDIFLEAAIFSGSQTRKTARELGLRTEASSRYERGIDPEAVLSASERALYLMKEIDPEVTVSDDWVTSGKVTPSQRKIEFSPSWIEEIMNCTIQPETMKKTMNRLGFTLDSTIQDSIIRLTVPSWRPDVQYPIDCAEEIGRIYGYDHIISRLPDFPFDPGNVQPEYLLENAFRQYLRSRGLKECVSLSLTSQANCDALNLPQSKYLRVQNPLSQDHVVLRPDLIITALEILKTNISRGRENFGFFELGEAFSPGEKNDDHPYLEEKRLIIVLNGSFYPPFWQKTSLIDIFYVKGLAENIIELIGYPLKKMIWKSISSDPYLDSSLSFQGLIENGLEVLRGGVIRQTVRDAFGFWGEHYCLEIAWEKILHHQSPEPFHLQEINRYPSVRRDISIVVDQNQTWKSIENMVRQVASKSDLPIELIELFDSYQGKHLPPDKKSYSFSIVFRSAQRTLIDNEVDSWVTIIKAALKNEAGFVLREDLAGGF